jgi:O-antigen/teichoic acid export membrane protein
MLANYLFLLSDKLLRMALGLITNVLLVAYLSPFDLGSWNYVLTVAVIAGAVSIYSGLDVVLIRELAQAGASERGRIVGSVVALRCLSGAAATAGSVAFVAWQGEWPLMRLILIVALSYFTQVLHALDYFFQSQLVFKFSALVLNATTTAGFIAKMVLMWLNLLNLDLLCWILVLESLLLGAGYLWLVVRNFEEIAPRTWRVDTGLVWRYMHAGLALLASGLVSVAIARISIFQIDSYFDRVSVAVFGLYVLVFEGILLANYSLANAYFPRIIVKQATPAFYARDLRMLLKRQIKLWAVITGGFALVVLAGRHSIEPLINPVYLQSLTMILFGLPVTALFIVNFYLLQFIIIPQGNQSHQLARALLGMCVLLASNSVFFHDSTVVMVVASMALSQLVILGFTLFMFRKKINELWHAAKELA